MTSDEYGQILDDFELNAPGDVMPGESLTEYIERRRREFESKADGGDIVIEVLFADKEPRTKMVSGGFLKSIGAGLGSLFKGGKDKIDDIIETKAMEKIGFRSRDDIPVSTYSEMKGPIKLSDMENIPEDQLKKILRTQELGLYEETPELLKAANLLERFTKKVKGKRVIDYERAEAILGVKLKGNETLDDLFKIEFETRPEMKADGGRVGLFMGGDPLEGQALQIYNSMKGYNFSDQEIADALSARGLYTAAGSGTTQPEQVTGIINQQIQTGGGDNDGFTGFGKFGNLDPTTEKTFTKDVYTIDKNAAPGAPMTGSFKPTEVTGYKNVNTGIYQTLEGKNINHAGINIKPGIVAIAEALGLGPIDETQFTGLPYKEGQIAGTFTGKKLSDFNPLNLFKKQQATLKEIQDMNKKAVDDLRAKQAAEKAAADAARAAEMARYNITSDSDFGGGTPGGGGGNVRTTGGDVYGGATRGGYNEAAEKTDYYRDGGLATMFTRRR